MTWIDYYNQGLNDVEIARLVGVSDSLIQQRRKKMSLPANFSYKDVRKIDYDKARLMLLKGRSVEAVAKHFKASTDAVYSMIYRMDWDIPSLARTNSPKLLTNVHKQFFVGCVMGDGSLQNKGGCVSTTFTCEHGIKQCSYVRFKERILRELDPKVREATRLTVDKRNGKYYSSCRITLGANPELDWMYQEFYKTGTKQLTERLLEYYTPFAMAVHYMDDGSKNEDRITIATQCFNNESIELLRKKLKKSYKIETTVWKDGTLYILKRSSQTFLNLIKPYIVRDLLYKVS